MQLKKENADTYGEQGKGQGQGQGQELKMTHASFSKAATS